MKAFKLRRRRWRPNAGVVLLVIGSATAGAAAGHLVWPPQVTTTTVVVAPATAALGPGDAVTMPDVEGLDERAARAVLADAGYPANAVKTTTTAAAGDVGRVVTQQPAPGSAPGPTPSVVLTVTKTAPMPNLVGQTREQATSAVTALHAAARIELVSTATKPAGTVLGTTPKAGAQMPAEVTLQVADGGTPVSLADLDPVEDARCSSSAENLSLNGTSFSTAFFCRPYPSQEGAAYLEYVLGRHATYLELTAGTPDQQDPTTSRVRVVIDGKAAGTFTVVQGKSTPIRVPVTGVLRLRIEVVTADKDATVLIGDPRVVGSAAAMDRLLS